MYAGLSFGVQSTTAVCAFGYPYSSNSDSQISSSAKARRALILVTPGDNPGSTTHAIATPQGLNNGKDIIIKCRRRQKNKINLLMLMNDFL